MLSAQEVTVLDQENGTPIPGVAIYNLDKSRTAISDFDGKADLSGFAMESRIIFSHISYEERRTTKAALQRRGYKITLPMKAEQLDEVVMSVSKWEQQRKDIPQKIASIDAQEIAFTTPQTAADLLQHSGQVFVQKSQLGGGSPMIRGFATNRLLLSVDGVRMNNAIFRGGNVQNVISLDPFNIRRTEVIFGPGSVIYGSDAIGGVMNFYTRKPTYAVGDNTHVDGRVHYRFASANSENTGHFSVDVGRERWAFLSSFSFSDFGDLRMGSKGPESYLRPEYVITKGGADYVVKNQNPLKQVQTGYNQANFMQKIAYKQDRYWEYELGLHYSTTSDFPRYDRLIRPGRNGQPLRSAEWYYGPQRWFMGNLKATQDGSRQFYDGMKATLAYQFFEESRHDRDFGDPVKYHTEEKVDAWSAAVDFENKRIGNLRLYYGTEYVYNKVHSDGWKERTDTGEREDAPSRYPDGALWQSLAAYTNAEYRLVPNMTLLGGLRYSHFWLETDFDRSFYPFPFEDARVGHGALTGSLGISWLPRPDLQLTLNGSTGFRAPNIDDVGKVFDSEPGSVVVPNPDLKPEYAYNAEIGARKNFRDLLVLKASAYYTELTNAMVRRDYSFNGQRELEYNGELSNVQAIQNVARAYVYGFEFGLEAFLTNQISVEANMTLTDGEEEDEGGDVVPARHVAPAFGDLHLLWDNGRLRADFFVNYNGEIAFENLAPSERSKPFIYATDPDGNPYSPSWYTLNLRSQYDISANWRAGLSLENLTDQRYRTYSSGIAAPGFNTVLSLNYTF